MSRSMMDHAGACALVLVPLASLAPAPEASAQCVSLSQTTAGQEYGGAFSAGDQYNFTGTEDDNTVHIAGSLGPINSNNPYNEAPPPSSPYTNLGFLLRYTGTLNCAVPAGAKLRATYRFQAAFTGSFEGFFPSLLGFNDDGAGLTSFVSATAIDPIGAFQSGVTITGVLETDAFAIDGAGGQWDFEVFFSWSQLAPGDAFALTTAPTVDITLVLPPPSCPADANNDGLISFPDIIEVLRLWGVTYPIGSGPADANSDGTVSFPDIIEVLRLWNQPCP